MTNGAAMCEAALPSGWKSNHPEQNDAGAYGTGTIPLLQSSDALAERHGHASNEE